MPGDPAADSRKSRIAVAAATGAMALGAAFFLIGGLTFGSSSDSGGFGRPAGGMPRGFPGLQQDRQQDQQDRGGFGGGPQSGTGTGNTGT